MFLLLQHIFSWWNSIYSQRFESGCEGRGWVEENVLMASCCHIPLHPRQALPASSPQTILVKGHEGIHFSHRCCYGTRLLIFSWVTFQSRLCPQLIYYHHQLSNQLRLASWDGFLCTLKLPPLQHISPIARIMQRHDKRQNSSKLMKGRLDSKFTREIYLTQGAPTSAPSPLTPSQHHQWQSPCHKHHQPKTKTRTVWKHQL